MALIIKSTNSENAIRINFTDTYIPEVYARVEYRGLQTGKKLEVYIIPYLDVTSYENEQYLDSTLPTFSHVVNILETEEQNLETANKYAKIMYENLGYEVTIIA